MKNVFALLATLWAVTGFAQNTQNATSSIREVTVFLNRAQVTRNVSTSLAAGKTEVVISGLTALLDPESIQVSGKGNFLLLGTRHRQNFLSDVNVPAPLKVLKDSLVGLQGQMQREQSEKEILNREEQLLLANQKIGGANQNLTVVELKGMADFFRGRLREIAGNRLKSEDKIKRLSEQIVRVQSQLNTENELRQRNSSEIVISVSAAAATRAELEVSYMTQQAGWVPQYDIRAVNTKNPIKLTYKASVFQTTGEDWSNVKLKLSTANPNLGGLKPELTPWYLDFYQPVAYRSKDKKMSAAPVMAMSKVAETVEEDMTPAGAVANYVTAIQTTLTTTFDISLPYTVRSAAQPTVVDIAQYDVDARYAYATAPKVDPDAFLLAYATGWEALNLLPGEANIFFEGTFTGKSFIDPNSVKDTLSLSLGRDKGVVVKREKIKSLTSRKFIGSNQKETLAWEISVRNTKTEQVQITVEDQVPVAQNAQIEVIPGDVGGAAYHPVTGQLSWSFTLAQGATRKMVFRYEVKYPKDKTVSGL